MILILEEHQGGECGEIPHVNYTQMRTEHRTLVHFHEQVVIAGPTPILIPKMEDII